MFHFEEKLKDLKVEYYKDMYTIDYKAERAVIVINSPPDLINAILAYDGKTEQKQVRDAHHITVGKGNLKRDVWHFSTPDGILPTLRCGFTSHSGASTWSSTPHPFEEKPVKGFEEAFLYLLSGGLRGAALQVRQGLWQDGSLISEVGIVFDRDISAIPMGYHPVVGEPGVHVSYIWAYLAKHKNWEKLP